MKYFYDYERNASAKTKTTKNSEKKEREKKRKNQRHIVQRSHFMCSRAHFSRLFLSFFVVVVATFKRPIAAIFSFL